MLGTVELLGDQTFNSYTSHTLLSSVEVLPRTKQPSTLFVVRFIPSEHSYHIQLAKFVLRCIWSHPMSDAQQEGIEVGKVDDDESPNE